MRIAQVAPLYESVPPQGYGGTERVVAYLTEALVDLGHEVTLFASADSRTRARLVPCAPRSLRLDPECADRLARHVYEVGEVFRRASEFDIIHNHLDYLPYPTARMVATPMLTTLHGRLDIPDLAPLFGAYPDMNLVSISDAQRAPFPRANWIATVYHGLPEDSYRFRPGAGGYLAFLGRIAPEKRVESAIQVAVAEGVPIKIAAKVDRVDREYFEAVVRPLLRHPLVEYVGEIGEAEKSEFLGDALALLFPIDWPEPFGLVMIEALACGTPVIALRRGSVPEVIRHGETGFVCDSVDEVRRAAARVSAIDRRTCRRDFETRFTAARMARDYLAAYSTVLGGFRDFKRVA